MYFQAVRMKAIRALKAVTFCASTEDLHSVAEICDMQLSVGVGT